MRKTGRLKLLLGGGVLVLYALVACLAPLVTAHGPYAQDLRQALRGPGKDHWLGTDELGRDVFSRVIYGARISPAIAVAAVAFALVAGTAIGCISGYFQGGLLEWVINGFIDLMLSFPPILLAIAMMAVVGAGAVNLALAIGLVSVPAFARLARGMTLVMVEKEFVEAARAVGQRPYKILVRHILPNIAAPLIVEASLRTGASVLMAAGLSFLGVGPPPPAPEWGSMLSSSRAYLAVAPYLSLAPGLAITLLVIGFNWVGEGVVESRRVPLS